MVRESMAFNREIRGGHGTGLAGFGPNSVFNLDMSLAQKEELRTEQ